MTVGTSGLIKLYGHTAPDLWRSSLPARLCVCTVSGNDSDPVAALLNYTAP